MIIVNVISSLLLTLRLVMTSSILYNRSEMSVSCHLCTKVFHILETASNCDLLHVDCHEIIQRIRMRCIISWLRHYLQSDSSVQGSRRLDNHRDNTRLDRRFGADMGCTGTLENGLPIWGVRFISMCVCVCVSHS